MTDLVERVKAHLNRCLHTYVEGDDTRATELTDEELCDIARAIIPIVLEDAAKQIAQIEPPHRRWIRRDDAISTIYASKVQP